MRGIVSRVGDVRKQGGYNLISMRCCVAAMLLTASSALSQGVIDASRVPKEWRDFRAQGDERRFDCSVSPIKPRLNYSFRFQTGYVVQVPMRQYVGKAHWIATLFRVTPENSERSPVYFLMRLRLPEEIPRNNATIEFGGGYVVGEGKYRVEMLVTDDTARVCTHDWTITAKFGRKEDEVTPGMPAGAVDEISLRKWTRGSKGASGQQGHRVTILMNASAVMPRRVRLGGYDRVLLLSSLASAIERLPLRSVRLVVFSLDQQREIFRAEDFGPADFVRLSRALNELELGTVDYETLKNRRGHLDLVADLIAESLREKSSDAVVFLGPKPWYFDKIERSSLPQRTSDDPAFFYVQFRPYIAAAAHSDTLMYAVKQMGGKTFDVYSPGDFAEAIRDITKAIEGSNRPTLSDNQ
jgi:hypothetical protein